MKAKLPELLADPAVAASSDREMLGVFDGLNATACSFYSSQGAAQLFCHTHGQLTSTCSPTGRIDSAFDDRNEQLVEDLTKTLPSLHTVEMETFHL
jgi:hypothetical protein